MTRAQGYFDRGALPVILFLIGAVPLFFWLDLNDTFDLPKLSLVYAAVLVLSALWAAQILTRGVSARRYFLQIAMAIFLATTLASAVRSIEPHLSFGGAYRLYVFGVTPIVAWAALAGFASQMEAAASTAVVRTAFVSAVAVALYALLQYTGHEWFDRMPLAIHGRPWASLGNSLYMGALCAMALPLAEALFVQQETAAARLGVFAGSVLLLAGLVLSLSRSAWIGAAFGCSWTGFLLARGSMPAARRRLFFFLAALFIGVGCGVLSKEARNRASVLFSVQEGSNAARLEGWKAGLRVWRDHPWLGSGPDTFNRSFRPYRSLRYIQATGASVTQGDAHNDFIQIAATEGGLGLLAIVLVLGALAPLLNVRFFNDAPIFYARGGMAGALIALFVQDQFNFSSVSTSAWAAVMAGALTAGSPSVERRLGVSSFGLRFAGAFAASALFVAGGFLLAKPLVADWYFQRGLIQAERAQPYRALLYYQKAAALEPSTSVYQIALSNAARDLGAASQGPDRAAWFDVAWRTAQTETQRHPLDPDSWNNRGVVAMWLTQLAGVNRMNDALASFQTAVTLDPSFVDAWANLAKWNHLAGDLDMEKKVWQKVIMMQPDHPMARRVLGLP